MADEVATRLADAIHELARAIAAVAPPLRGLPYLGLESASGTGTHLLDALSARGIFRKYEQVLDLGTGLGGTARWLTTRLGCEVVSVAPTPTEAAAAADLTRRARLPVRAQHFTHVWSVEALVDRGGAMDALAAAHAAVRPGGMLAVQELVLAGTTPPTVAGRRVLTTAELVSEVETAGFVEIEVRDRSVEAVERAARVTAARAQLLARLAADPVLAPVAATRTALAAALGAGAIGVVQVLARRP
jgi:hypothetical protein